MTRAVIYCRCSTEEECQKDALIRQAAGGKRMRLPPELVLRG